MYLLLQLQILIDGFPLKELDIKWLREKIGYVGQVFEIILMIDFDCVKRGFLLTIN